MCKDCFYNKSACCTSHEVPVAIISPFFKEDEPCPCYKERYSIVATDENGQEILLPARFHY